MGDRKKKVEELKDLTMKVCYLEPRFWNRGYHPETFLIHFDSMTEERLDWYIFRSKETIQRIVERTRKEKSA